MVLDFFPHCSLIETVFCIAGSHWKPSYVLGGTVGVSKTFQILYRKEDIELYDVFTFKVYMMLDVNKVCNTCQFFYAVSLSLCYEVYGVMYTHFVHCCSVQEGRFRDLWVRTPS